MTPMVVSIVIPAYNQGRFLAQAIQSALDQSHQSIQVVVVDDGSTDDTPDVLSRFAADQRVSVIRQANGGLPAVPVTTLVIGWSTTIPYALRTEVFPSLNGSHANPNRG